jgi:fermentation-respiration switch protein FrsA (DUF1100 family)
MLRRFEHSQIYHPDQVLQATGAELGRPFENIFFETSDSVRLNGWFYPANPGAARSSIALLLCHGNGGNISHRLNFCQALLELELNVLLFDYRGYGLSAGRATEAGTYLDAQAAYRWLERKGFPGRKIVAYGESLGGAVAAELAVREPTAGLVLQGTFTSIPDVGAEIFPWLPVRWLARVRYETQRKLPGLKIPVLVMHSRDDRLIRFQHGRDNFAAANEPKLFWEIQGEHNDPLCDRDHFLSGMLQFLRLLA